MLPDINLDQITFEEMVERAKNRITGIYPEWTDFNYHDPGITLVELFAWLKEIQQYELNHIGAAHKRKYLQLLGTDIKHRTGAEAYLRVELKERHYLPLGSRFFAAEIPFETEETQVIPGNAIVQSFGFLEKKISYMSGEQMDLGQLLEFYPFGRNALPGTCCYIQFKDVLPCGEVLHLTIKTRTITENIRNCANEDMIPLGDIEWSYWNGKNYQPLDIIRDETKGLLFDGQFVFRLSEEMQPQEVDKEKGYFIRARLLENYYDIPPVLSFLDMNTIKVRQRETMAFWTEAKKSSLEERKLNVTHAICSEGNIQVFSEQDGYFSEIEQEDISWKVRNGTADICIDIEETVFKEKNFWVLLSSKSRWYQQHKVLGKAYGFPNESFALEDTCLCYEDLELLVEEPEREGVYRKWEKRADFSRSGPEDCHYCIDGHTGCILFGDCFNGMAPEGRILLVSYSRVLGLGGNVKVHKITRTIETDKEVCVSNPWDAKGGMEEETLEEAFARVQKELSQCTNMVTEDDYEQTVLKTPGLLIESCQALAGEEDTQIGIVVKPYSLEKQPKLNPILKRNIIGHLEKKRLLGTQIKLLSPVYVKLSVYVEVVVKAQYQGAKRKVELAAEEYLKPYKKSFGKAVSYSGMYGYLDRLDCVVSVRSLVLDAKGNGVKRNTYGDLIFPGNGIADEIEIQCSYSVEHE